MEESVKNFALIGAAGYVAPRHMRAIKELGHELVAAMDPSDSVGVLDQYFPKVDFFTEFERFDRHLEKLKRQGEALDYLSVCTPNYLHDAHIRFGLRLGAEVICEKPLVLNPWNLAPLIDLEQETGKKVSCILQLRLHPSVQALKQKVESAPAEKIFDVDLTYITSRGKWYYASWKGDESKSGGVATNIGVHFFDMLQWVFGPVQHLKVHVHNHDRAAGYLELERARVRWFLSINGETLPEAIQHKELKTFRSVQLDGEQFEFSDGFHDLHTQSYQNILLERGFGISEAQASIEMIQRIRQAEIEPLQEDYHPMAKLPLSHHPFINRMK